MLGVLMARMIVFWSPYIMIVSSVAVCDYNFWKVLINKLNQSTNNSRILVSFLRHLMLIFAIVMLYISQKENILTQLDDLREFWDPDTVDLMEWINQKSPKQLLLLVPCNCLQVIWSLRESK